MSVCHFTNSLRSSAALLLLALYAICKGKFIPYQTYHDTMQTIKNVYFCIAKAKLDNPSGKFFIICLGSDPLEKVFGKFTAVRKPEEAAGLLLEIIQRVNPADNGSYVPIG